MIAQTKKTYPFGKNDRIVYEVKGKAFYVQDKHFIKHLVSFVVLGEDFSILFVKRDKTIPIETVKVETSQKFRNKIEKETLNGNLCPSDMNTLFSWIENSTPTLDYKDYNSDQEKMIVAHPYLSDGRRMTIIARKDNDSIKIGFAVCSKKDEFNKKTGKMMANIRSSLSTPHYLDKINLSFEDNIVFASFYNRCKKYFKDDDYKYPFWFIYMFL